MRIDPELPDHPKFVALENVLGPETMKFLVRIWGHCQRVKQGEMWGACVPSNTAYIDQVVRLPARSRLKGRVLSALVEFGFASEEVDPTGRRLLRIHSWEEYNPTLIQARISRENGRKGGRPRLNSNGLSKPIAKTEEPVAKPNKPSETSGLDEENRGEENRREMNRGEEGMGSSPLNAVAGDFSEEKNAAVEDVMMMAAREGWVCDLKRANRVLEWAWKMGKPWPVVLREWSEEERGVLPFRKKTRAELEQDLDNLKARLQAVDGGTPECEEVCRRIEAVEVALGVRVPRGTRNGFGT